MSFHEMSKEDLLANGRIRFTIVPDKRALDLRIAREIADHIRAKTERYEKSYLILPVGPLDYSHLAEICNSERISLENLSVFMMDEYLDVADRIIPRDHPLSFFRFMKENLVELLDAQLKFGLDNIHFPDPDHPGEVTRMIEEIGGVDICYGGFGITGHFAFNDPPEPGVRMSVEEMKNARARKLTISRESTTQMGMGGTNGNLEILPRRAVTLGMYELLMSKKIHLTFMRSWHSGVLRRALFGPVTAECPGSLIQEHPNFEVTLTELAARPPMLNVAQDTGEEKEA